MAGRRHLPDDDGGEKAMFEKEPDDLDDGQREATHCAPEEERQERVARVIESVRSGTYQVRSDVVANRLMDAMLRRPRKR